MAREREVCVQMKLMEGSWGVCEWIFPAPMAEIYLFNLVLLFIILSVKAYIC